MSTSATAERSDRTGRIAGQVGRWALLGILILLLVGFSVALPSTFGTAANFKSIADNEVPVVFIAFAATLPLIVGEFDLSIAAVFTWSQVIVVGLVIQHGWPVPLAILAGAASAIAVGLINGLAVVRFGINSFIATLASGSILTGVTLAYTNGLSIFGNAPSALTSISRSRPIAGITLPVFYAVIAAIVIAIILGRLPVGRRMYATGGNQRAAQLTGIATGRYVIATFVASSLLAAVGGLLLGAKIGAASSDTGGTLLIQGFAAAFLGSTAFFAGRFNILGTLVAVYVVGVAVTGLEQEGASLWVAPVFEGVVLFVAVGLAAWTGRLRANRAKLARLRELEERRAGESNGGPPAPPVDAAIAGPSG